MPYQWKHHRYRQCFSMHATYNVFDAIGKPSVKNQTLENRSSLINRYIYKVRKLSLSNTVVAFPVTSILQQCVHVPVKHSETDFIILQPNPFEHH